MKLYRPEHWNWVTLSGADAKDFLHRLTTVNVKFLRTDQGSSGCFLTPQGKIRAYFTLWNTGPDRFTFEFDGGTDEHWKTELFTLIDQYTFGEKLTLTDETSHLDSRWLFLEEEDGKTIMPRGMESLQAGQTRILENQIRVCHHGLNDFGQPWLTLWGKDLPSWISAHLSNAHPIDLLELEKKRIRALRPKIDVEILLTSSPLELGLTDAIASNKGCYPGQEVIEKIMALGSPAKRLAQIEGQGSPPRVGEMIFTDAQPPLEIGQVTSVTSSGEAYMALGLIKKIHAKEGLAIRFSEKNEVQGAIIKIAPYA
jgi:folate-binding protein YgfZ